MGVEGEGSASGAEAMASALAAKASSYSASLAGVLGVEFGDAEVKPALEGVHRAESQRRGGFVEIRVRVSPRFQRLGARAKILMNL